MKKKYWNAVNVKPRKPKKEKEVLNWYQLLREVNRGTDRGACINYALKNLNSEDCLTFLLAPWN